MGLHEEQKVATPKIMSASQNTANWDQGKTHMHHRDCVHFKTGREPIRVGKRGAVLVKSRRIVVLKVYGFRSTESASPKVWGGRKP